MENRPPKIIAITGPSAAGKTTLCSFLAASFDEEFEHIRQDDYMKDPSTYPMQGRFQVWEDPSNVKFDIIAQHLVKLKQGNEVAWQTFAKNESEPVYHYIIKPKPYILLEGTMILTSDEVSQLADLKIYLDVPLEVSLARRAVRAKQWNLDLTEYDQEMMVPLLKKHRQVQRFNTDYIIDGTKPKREVADEAKNLITQIINSNENKSPDPSYISGLWDQSHSAKYFSGNQ